MCHFDGVVDDVNFCVCVGLHVDGAIGDHQDPVVVRNCHVEDMAKAPARAEAVFAIDDGLHEGIRVQMALHQRRNFTGLSQCDGGGGGFLFADGVDDRKAGRRPNRYRGRRRE